MPVFFLLSMNCLCNRTIAKLEVMAIIFISAQLSSCSSVHKFITFLSAVINKFTLLNFYFVLHTMVLTADSAHGSLTQSNMHTWVSNLTQLTIAQVLKR